MLTTRKIFSSINLQIPKIVLVVLLIVTAIAGWLYYASASTNKLAALLGSLVIGLIIVIVQYLFSWTEYMAVSKIQSLGIYDVLLHRDDRDFYQRLISKASSRVDVMGVTAGRFMDDFADKSSHRPDTKVLLEAMSRGVEVRILVPDPKQLVGSDLTIANTTAIRFNEIATEYKAFHYRYFDHEPAHSIVVVDDACLIGPIFPQVPSKHTPAIYIKNDSEYARRYLEYFDKEWNKSAIP